jgi:hypothetical protein
VLAAVFDPARPRSAAHPWFDHCARGYVRPVPPRIALAVVLLACAAAVAHAAAPTYVVVADERIGSFRVKSDGTLGGAIGAFGKPTSVRGSGGESCLAVWRPINLTMNVYNLGGQDPCTARYGMFARAIMRGPSWRTSKGLRVGDPVARLRRLYPAAKLHRGLRHFWPAGYWLVPRGNRFGYAGTYPGLLAETRGGRIASFVVRYQAGGD